MEFSDIGHACGYCRVHDYLPFLCNGCNLYYCLTHKNYCDHECKKSPYKKNKTRRLISKNSDNVYKCNYTNCKCQSVVEFKCMRCNMHYCLKHRHCETHKCKN